MALPDEQEATVEKHRTGGMTAIAVLNLIFGGFGTIYGLAAICVRTYWLVRLDVFTFPRLLTAPGFALVVLGLATGIVGIIGGIGIFALRPWARGLSLVYAGLFIFAGITTFAVPIIFASWYYGLPDVGPATGQLSPWLTSRVLVMAIFEVAIPLIYFIILYVVFRRPVWKATFAKSWAT